MSYIDTIKHEFVGYFLGLPIYHPLEEVEYEDCSSGDFSSSPNTFIIGGGGGEHPGVVLKFPIQMVNMYLSFRVDLLEEEEEVEESIIKIWNDKLLHYCDIKNKNDFFNFCGWSLENYKNFIKWCESSALTFPYSKKYFDSIENWILLSFGEFILFSFPELVSDLINDFSDLLVFIKHSELNNISIPIK